MPVIRRILVGLFSLILLISLVTGAAAYSLRSNLGKPDKLESALNQSSLYDQFIRSIIGQVDTLGATNGTTIAVSDPAVQTAIRQAFSSDELSSDVDAFVTANYSWLEGKSDKPIFSINLSSAKQNFATLLGQSVTQYLSGLKVCSLTELQTLQGSTQDLLRLPCRPFNVSAATAGAEVKTSVANNQTVLQNTTLTAEALNPNGVNGTPYYTRLSFLPRLYQAATKLPGILTIVSIVSMLIIYFAARKRRIGLRHISIIFTEAGLLLIVVKLVSGSIITTAQRHAANSTIIPGIGQSLSSVTSTIAMDLLKTILLFGELFVAVGIVGFILSFVRRAQRGTPNSGSKLSPEPVFEEPGQEIITDPMPPVSTAPKAPAPLKKPRPRGPRLAM